MTCAECEKRREWMRKQYERAEQRMRKVLRNLGVINSTEQQDYRAEQSIDSGEQRAERSD